ncbi:hypothetical protein TRVA0_022S02058 [Trichomonascus vanleenenianus]|uniref:uncharacterized protein n=1 Tax=Trichomonascus vanleenenianus TaxID=2268995 RepID=UPI003EC9BC7E
MAKRRHDEEEEEDDSDDMFNLSDSDGGQENKPEVPPCKKGARLDADLLDSWTDAEGYYRVITGELLHNQYQILATLGRGTFATVISARDEKENKTVAIKVIRNNEVMYKAGLKEVALLERLRSSKAIVKLLTSFRHKGHLCMVFEYLAGGNLRDVLKKYGRTTGLNIRAVQTYARQCIQGLEELKSCGIVHGDIKPDNILANERNTVLKVADLGSACLLEEVKPSSYLMSRFYRAPEVIINMPQLDYAVDMWALGCTLYELYTGQILFTGRDNNDMLRQIMDTRGKLSHKMIRRGTSTESHFDSEYNFTDRHEGKTFSVIQATESIKMRLAGMEGELNECADLLTHFIDLLDRMLMLNPAKRITPHQALKHPFLSTAT